MVEAGGLPKTAKVPGGLHEPGTTFPQKKTRSMAKICFPKRSGRLTFGLPDRLVFPTAIHHPPKLIPSFSMSRHHSERGGILKKANWLSFRVVGHRMEGHRITKEINISHEHGREE